MKKRSSSAALVCALLLSALFFLSACSGGSGGADGSGDAGGSILTPDEAGTLVIPTAALTTEARFYDYKTEDATVQIVALRDGNGTVHAAFNTCQSCSPSPKAYYAQDGDRLICQNCGFDFTAEEVGITHGGCNPWPIPGVEITGDEIRIPADAAEDMRPVFAAEGR